MKMKETITGDVASGFIVEEYGYVEPPTLVTLTAKSRLNKATLARLGPKMAQERVKDKLVKALLWQLIDSKAVKIDSIVNAKTGSVSFTATVVAHEAA